RRQGQRAGTPRGERRLAALSALNDQANRTRPRPADPVTARPEPLPRTRPTEFRARGVLCRQLPVYSPLPLAAVWRAAAQGLRLRDDPRPRVAGLLRGLYGADEALLLGSGTQALQLAIRTAVSIIGEPCAVALPAFSCYDVATAAAGAQVRLPLYDLTPPKIGPVTS